MATNRGSDPTRGRWLLAGAAVLVQLALGAVYAWSVFVNPFIDQMGWSRTETSLPFIVTIGVLFVGTLAGGRIQDRIGPRPVVLAGGIIYSVGVMLASLVETPDQLWLLVLTYGVIAGLGLGAGYIVPIAMLVKWFPDRRGLITGIAVAGFGAGALLTAPVANRFLVEDDVSQIFLPLGLAYLVATVVGGAMFRNPPSGYQVPGFDSSAVRVAGTAESYSLGEALRTPHWYILTAILALNVTAGIALISQAAPAAVEIAGMTPAGAAGVVGALAIFNGARPCRLGVGKRLHRPHAGVLRDLRPAGSLLRSPPERLARAPLRNPRRPRVPLLRGWLRNDAGHSGRLFRTQECGSDLRGDDRRVERGWRRRSAGHRRDRGCHGRVYGAFLHHRRDGAGRRAPPRYNQASPRGRSPAALRTERGTPDTARSRGPGA